MKIIIEHEGRIVSSESDVVTLIDTMDIIKDLLVGVGFSSITVNEYWG